VPLVARDRRVPSFPDSVWERNCRCDSDAQLSLIGKDSPPKGGASGFDIGFAWSKQREWEPLLLARQPESEEPLPAFHAVAGVESRHVFVHRGELLPDGQGEVFLRHTGQQGAEDLPLHRA